MFIEFLEYLVYNGVVSGYMFIFGFFWSSRSVDHHIVHVNRHASLGDEVSKDSVHHRLKRGWRISESKEHDRWFE